MKVKCIVLLGAFLIGAGQLKAQESDASGENLDLPGFFDDFSVGGMGGLSLFYGDLANYYVFPKKEDRANSIRYGYKPFVEKDIWKGLGARAMFSKGRLAGGSQNGDQSHKMNFRGDYLDMSLQAKFRLSDFLFNKASESRFFFQGYIGFGYIGFRAIETYDESGLVRNYVGYFQTDETQNDYSKLLQNKDKRVWRPFIPVGLKTGLRLSGHADLIFEMNLNNVQTDLMDTWVRTWTADDKYGFIGLGIQFTFNRSDEELKPLIRINFKKNKDDE